MWDRFHFEDGASDYWQRMSTASFFSSLVAIIFYCLSANQLKHKNLMILTGFAVASGFQHLARQTQILPADYLARRAGLNSTRDSRTWPQAQDYQP